MSARRRAPCGSGAAGGSADHVLMNPPFNDPRGSTRPMRATRGAHAAARLLRRRSVLDRAATRLLRASGTLTLIWRADGLGDVLRALATRFRRDRGAAGSPRSRNAGDPRLVRAVKGGRAPLALAARPDAQRRRQGGRTPAAEAVLRSGGRACNRLAVNRRGGLARPDARRSAIERDVASQTASGHRVSRRLLPPVPLRQHVRVVRVS